MRWFLSQLVALGGTLGEIAVELVLFCLSSQLHLLLLCDCVEVSCHDEPDKGEERFPNHSGQVVLRHGDCDGGSGPSDPHHGPEGSLNSLLDVVYTSGTVDVGHTAEIDSVGKDGNGEVGSDDLEDLVLGTGSAFEGFLEEAGENVSHGSRDKEAIEEHFEGSLIDAELGSIRLDETSRVLLSSTFLFVKSGRCLGGNGCNTSKMAGKNFGKCREDTRGDHLGAEWVGSKRREVADKQRVGRQG